MNQLDDFINRAGDRAVLMVSPVAYTEIRNETQPVHWHLKSNREMYRGALVELHDEWSWGWMVRKADGTYVEAQAIEARRAETENTGSVEDESAVANGDAPKGE